MNTAQAQLGKDRTDRDLRPDFLIAGGAFLLYEAVVITLLSGVVFGEIDSGLVYLAIAAIAGGAGYAAIGYVTGSWASIVFIALPVVIALAIGGTNASDSPGTGEVPLYVAWTAMSYFFVPAWLAGLLVAFVLRRGEPDSR